MINYYHLPTKHMRSLILIIAMSNHTMKLSAGKMIEMSLVTFTDVSNISNISIKLTSYYMFHKQYVP